MNILDVASWVAIALAVCSALAFARRQRGLGWGLLSILLAMVLLGSPMFVNASLAWLESRHVREGRACQAKPNAPVVVLAGGISHPVQAVRGRLPWEQLTERSVFRVVGVTPYVLRNPQQPVVVTGGLGHRTTEAELMADLFQRLGLPVSRLIVENHSMSTAESAVALRRLFDSQKRPLEVVLATSALHMWRAQAAFSKQGFQVCPYAVDYQRRAVDSGWSLIPQSRAMAKMQLLLHEVVGYIYYALKGRL